MHVFIYFNKYLLSAYFVSCIVGRYSREQHKVLAVVELNFNGGEHGRQETKLIIKVSTQMNAMQRFRQYNMKESICVEALDRVKVKACFGDVLWESDR